MKRTLGRSLAYRSLLEGDCVWEMLKGYVFKGATLHRFGRAISLWTFLCIGIKLRFYMLPNCPVREIVQLSLFLDCTCFCVDEEDF